MTAEEKFNKVMHKWGKGDLHDRSGKLIPHPSGQDQAVAISFSEARKIDPNYGIAEKGKSLNEEDNMTPHEQEVHHTMMENYDYPVKKADVVWEAWSDSQRRHFLEDHSDELSKHISTKPTSFYSIKEYNALPKEIKNSIQNHIERGRYAHGGKTKENYLILVLHSKNEYERAKEFFEGSYSSFSVDKENDEFRSLYFKVSDQDDADVTEREIEKELLENDFDDYTFESEIEDEVWIDPAGGKHYGDEDDPASMYMAKGGKIDQIKLYIKEALDYLDGRGIIYTDEELVDEALNEYDLSSLIEYANQSKDDKIKSELITLLNHLDGRGIVFEDEELAKETFKDFGTFKTLKEYKTGGKSSKKENKDFIVVYGVNGEGYSSPDIYRVATLKEAEKIAEEKLEYLSEATKEKSKNQISYYITDEDDDTSRVTIFPVNKDKTILVSIDANVTEFDVEEFDDEAKAEVALRKAGKQITENKDVDLEENIISGDYDDGYYHFQIVKPLWVTAMEFSDEKARGGITEIEEVECKKGAKLQKLRTCPIGTSAQAILLHKDYFPSERSAKAWMLKHKDEFKSSNVRETKNYWRFRQNDPSEYRKESFRIIELTTGVKADIACPIKKSKTSVKSKLKKSK